MDTADEAMLRKFQKELNAGTVSLVLLAILDHSGEPLYGYQIAKSIEGAWGEGVPVKQGTLYPVLRSMEENGLLQQPSRAERFGPASEVLLDHRPGTCGPRRLEGGVGPYHAASSMRHWRGTVANTVEGYLAELRTALSGADPALVQDALYDAEEYLRTALADAGRARTCNAGVRRGGRRLRHSRGGRRRVPRRRADRRRRAAQAAGGTARSPASAQARSGGSSASSWTRRRGARSSTCSSRSRPGSCTSRSS